MASRKCYQQGILLLISACLLMHLFAKSAENLRLLYYVLEFLGIYNGYRFTTQNTIIWIVLVVAIFTLVSFSFRLMWNAYSNTYMKKWLKVIPFL